MNTFSNKTYSKCRVRIPKLYKRVTARSYCLNRLDETMTNLQNRHWATLRSSCRLTWMWHTIVALLL